MTSPSRRYVLELVHLDQAHTPIGQFEVTPDFETADQASFFAALRSGRLAPGQPAGVTRREPVWDKKRGEPFVDAIAIHVRCGLEYHVHAVGREYFKPLAQSTAEALVKQKQLKEGSVFEYTVLAYPARGPTAAENAEGTMSFVVASEPNTRLLEGAARRGEAPSNGVDVFIPQQVLDEASEMTRTAGAREIGGVLIGHLCRDTKEQHRFFVNITALIPATHTINESTQIIFKPETWTAALAAIRLRGKGEQMMGWFHSHPATSWCNPRCPVEARKRCPLQRIFFSDLDIDFHKKNFTPAYAIALLCTATMDGLRFTLYGWNEHGWIAQRGFHVAGNPSATEPTVLTPVAAGTVGGALHVPC